MIKGLIFDLDGTLTLSQQFHYQAFHQVFAQHGITYSPQDDMDYAGKGSACIFPEIFARQNLVLSDEQVKTYSAEKKKIYESIVQRSEVQPVPGVKDFLEQMKRQGLKMIVASGNQEEFIDLLLRKAGIRDYFQDFVTNKEVKNSKPAPDVFLKAAEKLELQPEECIVFEDAANGVHAAKAAKIKCIGIATGLNREELKKEGADVVIKDYTEITEAVWKSIS